MSDDPTDTGLPPLPAPPGPARRTKSPGAALLLSLFPGLGQVYNGQPAKAAVFFCVWAGAFHAAVWRHPMPFVLILAFVYFYNLVDAYKSAVLINVRTGGETRLDADASESPAWGATLIGVGLLLLLNNLGWIQLDSFERFWPVLLIVAGGALLRGSVQEKKPVERHGHLG